MPVCLFTKPVDKPERKPKIPVRSAILGSTLGAQESGTPHIMDDLHEL
jgi:hypothetical protein